MILATSGLQGVSIWRFLFYCDTSSGDGRLQKSPDFLPDPKKNSPADGFSPGKKGLVSPIFELSNAKKRPPTPLINQSMNQLNKFPKGTALTGWSRVNQAHPLDAQCDSGANEPQLS
jgi:hypothetical protein